MKKLLLLLGAACVLAGASLLVATPARADSEPTPACPIPADE